MALHDAGPSHRRRAGYARRTGARARTARRAWTDRPRREYAADLEDNLRVAARPREVRHVPGAARAAGAHPEGRRRRRGPSASRPSRTRSCSARSRWCWRPSTSRTFWTARTASGRGARRIKRWTRCGTRLMEMGGRLGPGGRHPEVLRHPGPRPAAGDSSTRGYATECCCADRQVAERGRAGGRGASAPRRRHAAGRGDLAAPGEHLPARGAGHVVSSAT